MLTQLGVAGRGLNPLLCGAPQERQAWAAGHSCAEDHKGAGGGDSIARRAPPRPRGRRQRYFRVCPSGAAERGAGCHARATLSNTRQGTQFTCFTGTKVQILTPEELYTLGHVRGAADAGAAVRSLLALLVQQYRY